MKNKKFTDKALAQLALDASKQTYSPYSHFPVGAALETDSQIFLGTNVENASYGLTICAERNAVFAAVAAGERKFKRLAVAAPTKQFILPCGGCLQVVSEFCDDLPLILVNADLKIKKTSLKKLLTSPFRSLRK